MRTGILIAFACCLALAVAEVNKKCNKNSDCGDGECCVQLSMFLSAKCKKLKEEHQLCFPNDDLNKSGDVYRFMCPCAEGLTCTSKETDEDGDTKIYRMPDVWRAAEWIFTEICQN